MAGNHVLGQGLPAECSSLTTSAGLEGAPESIQMLAAAAARASRTRPSSVITPGLLLAGSLESKQSLGTLQRYLHRWRGSQCPASDTLRTWSVLRAVQNRTVSRFAGVLVLLLKDHNKRKVSTPR